MNNRIITLSLLLSMSAVALPAIANDDPTVSAQIHTEVRAELGKRFEEAKASTTARIMGIRASTTERLKELKAGIEARKAEFKIQAEARKASSTAKRIEIQQALAKKKAAQTSRMLTATVERLEKIIVRLESRVAKVKAAGGVTVETEAFIAEAKVHLTAAKASIATFVSVDLSGDKLQDNFERIRTLAMDAKEEIRGAHQSLVEALKSLKGAGGENDEHATSTAHESGDNESGNHQ